MEPPPVVLDWYLGYMHKMLRDAGVPMWDGVLLTEDVEWDNDTHRISHLGKLYAVDEYRARFTDLATHGWSWINLHALGLLENKLVLSIELPGHNPPRPGATSVNMSGVSNWVTNHGGYSIDDLLDSRRPD